MTAEGGERGQQCRVMEDCSTDERLQQETLCRQQWTDEYVERPETLMRQNIVVVWLQSLLFDTDSKNLSSLEWHKLKVVQVVYCAVWAVMMLVT